MSTTLEKGDKIRVIATAEMVKRGVAGKVGWVLDAWEAKGVRYCRVQLDTTDATLAEIYLEKAS